MKDRLKNLSPTARHELSIKVQARLAKQLSLAHGHWGAFKPLKSEPEIEWERTNPLINWCFPDVNGEELEFTSKAGRIDIKDLNGICVPALAYHKNGARLGRGMGFYDKTFKHFEGTKIGIAFDFSVSDQVPFEPHDLIVHFIVTDQQVLTTG